MTQDYKHPITPPPELVKQWCHDRNRWTDFENVLAIRSAQWGADQELEACCELLQQKGIPAWSLLRLHRRPKPLRLKEEAIAALEEAGRKLPIKFSGQYDIIRRALEQLPDHE